jgi:hypothetical protein
MLKDGGLTHYSCKLLRLWAGSWHRNLCLALFSLLHSDGGWRWADFFCIGVCRNWVSERSITRNGREWQSCLPSGFSQRRICFNFLRLLFTGYDRERILCCSVRALTAEESFAETTDFRMFCISVLALQCLLFCECQNGTSLVTLM